MTERADVVAKIKAYLPILRERYRVHAVRLYGSLARGEERPESDVDLLLEFDEVPTLFDLAHIQEDLEAVLHRKVDVTTPGGLHPTVLKQALAEGIEVGA